MKWESYPFFKAAMLYIEDVGSTIHLWRIIEYFGDTPVGDIERLDIIEAGQEILPKASRATRRREIETVVTAIVNFIRGNRREKYARPASTRFFTPEEVDRLLEAADDANVVGHSDPKRHTLKKIAFMIGTGSNPGEMMEVNVSDVLPETKQIWVGKEKSRFRPRWTRPADRAWDLMGTFPTEGRAFRTPHGKPHTLRQRGGGQMADAFRTVADAAGVKLKKGEGPSLLRDSWATWHYAQNRDLQLLLRHGGWAKADTAFYYAKYVSDDLAVRALRLGWDFRA